MNLSWNLFSDWWLRQLRALVPPGWMPAPKSRDALIIAIDRLDDTQAPLAGELLLRRAGRELPISPLLQPCELAATDRHLATFLRLPPDAVLSRDLVLPLAAGDHLRTVIGFDMERLTPFTADELYWSVSGLQRDRARGKLSLKLTFVLRAQVEALRPALARLRLAPTCIETAHGRIELTAKPGRADGLRQHALSALCGVLALLCVALPFLRQKLALDAVAQTIAAETPAAEQAMALRRQIAIADSGRAIVASARHDGDALQVLAMLTAALPDGTWLSDLALNAGDLTIDGQSSNAAKLIGLLSAVPGLRNPSFTAPVTRTADGSADLFSLHATVAP